MEEPRSGTGSTGREELSVRLCGAETRLLSPEAGHVRGGQWTLRSYQLGSSCLRGWGWGGWTHTPQPRVLETYGFCRSLGSPPLPHIT